MPKIHEIIGDYPTFIERVLSKVVDAGFDLEDFSQIDHMCYRTVSMDNYAQKKADLKSVARLLGDTIVNDRPISTFRLDNPVMHDSWRIDLIELPAPKAGSDYEEGLEHIEFVLYDDIPTFLKKYNGLPFETRSSNRGINPEVGLRFDEFSVKFHLLSLSTVLYLENKLGIHEVRDSE